MCLHHVKWISALSLNQAHRENEDTLFVAQGCCLKRLHIYTIAFDINGPVVEKNK